MAFAPPSRTVTTATPVPASERSSRCSQPTLFSVSVVRSFFPKSSLPTQPIMCASARRRAQASA